ncbi:MAG TPA: autotransporter assembly complex family protein [Gammaproteobacteria bacterium]|nr:autotransporter assembly complex family protein [Gammaproteobacteria bacterium]
MIGALAPLGVRALEVEITGLPPDLEKNVRAFLSIPSIPSSASLAQTSGSEGQEAKQGDEGKKGEKGKKSKKSKKSEKSKESEQSEADRAAQDAKEAKQEITEQRLRRFVREAPEQIRAALQPFGYYDPKISESAERRDDEWVIRYAVDPGEPTVIGNVDIDVRGEGSNDPRVQAALRGIRIARGDVLNHQRYATAKQRLLQAANDAGYIDASYERAEMLVRPKDREADIYLILDTGPRYYFGNISIEQDILDPSFVARFVPIEPGSPFETDRLLALQQSLNDSGYFSSVTVEVEREEAENHRIPVVVHTTPRPTQDYQIGFGYGTDTGPRVSLGVELRRLNRSGHRFRADFRLSSIEQTAATEYRIPIRDVATDYLAFRTTLGALDVGDWNTQQLVLGASWHNQWRRAQHRLYVTAQRERYWTAASPAEQTGDLFFAGVQLSRQEADDLIYPRNGYSWSGDLRAGSDALGSVVSFERLYLAANLVRPIGKRMRYLMRVEYGALDVRDLALLPPSQRFYAGGESSVRGYAYQALSPSGPEGDSLGGRYLLTGSAELDVLIVGDYGAAFFYDAGNAANDPWPKLKRGVGVGLRWRSPVGMVGIDLAHPLDDPETSFRLHLHIGAEL